jgi:murein DD-endopeptidase MepM/ murein hydrolase activator NlpD
MAEPYDDQAKPAVGARNSDDSWDWPAFDGALALALQKPRPQRPERAGTHLNLVEPSGSVVGMARPEAAGLAARAALRASERAKVRRARRLAALIVVGSVALVVLLLTAFASSGGKTVSEATGPAPAQRLLPAGPPRPQVVAMNDTLRLQLPINQGRVTAIGYHASGPTALPLEPVGSQANAGLFGRIRQKLFGADGSGLRYYMLEGGTGPSTGGLDVGAPVGTDVYAPVDGTVIAISDRILDGVPHGKQIEIQPAGNPSIVVLLTNLNVDPSLSVGSTVIAARSKLGRLIDLSAVERAGLAHYTQDQGQHVHIEAHTAASAVG